MSNDRPSVPKIYAHRGFWWPDHLQNSKEAILRAGRYGADGVEVDVRMTLDGELVLCHDKRYKHLEIAGSTIDSLWGRSSESKLAAPLLDESLASFEGLMNLEIKRDSLGRISGVIDRLTQVMKSGYWRQKVKDGHVLFSSFDLETLEEAKEALPFFPRYLLLDRSDSTRRGVHDALRLGCEGINIHHLRASSYALSLCRDSGLKVGLWTLDDPVRAAGFCYPPVSNIITNRVDLLVKGH